MKVTVHRGQNEIGGSIIEIASEKTRLIFDVGIELDVGDEHNVPQIDGLFCGEKKYDAVIISHNHADHVGLVDDLVEGIPVYMGRKAFELLSESYKYRKLPMEFKLENDNIISDGKRIVIGDMEIIPIECDHSAFESFMFIIKCGGKSILYTGDFRSNGRKDFSGLLERIPHTDAVIIEGTTLSRVDRDGNEIENIPEEKLEDIANNALKKYTGPCFILTSSMNIDRLVTMSDVAKANGRIFAEDVYTANIATASGIDSIDPNKSKWVKVYQIKQSDHDELISKYNSSKIGRGAIGKSKFILNIKQSYTMKNWLQKLSEVCSFENGILFYGLWSGYKEEPKMKEFLEFMESKGVKVHTLHTSGHADPLTIRQLISKASPKMIIPVHTENAKWFEENYPALNVINSTGEDKVIRV